MRLQGKKPTTLLEFPPMAFMGLLGASILALAVGLIAVASFVEYINRPEVYWSHTHDRCVRVVDMAAHEAGRTSEWSCSNLPPKYELVWVR